MVTDASTTKPYRDRIGGMAREINPLNKKYDPFLDLHKIEDIDELFDVIQVHGNPLATGKLIWKVDRDLPIELVRDVTDLFEKHFVDQPNI